MRQRLWRTLAVELDTLPVMNLFVALIPFLLLAVAFVRVGVIPTSTPVQGESRHGSPRAVTLTIVVDGEGLRVTARSGDLPTEELAALSTAIPRRGGRHDHQRNVLVPRGPPLPVLRPQRQRTCRLDRSRV